MTYWEFLLQPLGYAFMQRGFLAAVLVGVTCAVVGTYVVLRGMAFLGDALAHAILPGVAVGYLVGNGSPSALFWGALGAGVVSAIGIGFISRRMRLREDTAIGIVFVSMFALGIALISSVGNYSIDLAHFLFGNVLGVSSADLWRVFIIGSIVLLVVFLFYKEFLVLSFDPLLASTLRLPARALDYLLLILIALSIVISLQTVGVALMVAMLVIPAASAQMLTRRLPRMMVIAAVFAAACGVVGLYLSYFWGIASGAAIVLTSTLVFLISWSIRTWRERFSPGKP